MRPFTWFLLFVLLWLISGIAYADKVDRWGPIVKRESQSLYGLNAPVPMFLGQIRQESSGNELVTAWDGGMGLGQFMPSTVNQITRNYPELGLPEPYNPVWSIRALIRLDQFNYDRIRGATICDRWGASLKAYNAGLGYILRAQRKSSKPDFWFGETENINAGQSQTNFEYSRRYPHMILEKHQLLYTGWGVVICQGSHHGH